MATTQNQKLLVAIALSTIIIGLSFDHAQAQKKPKPTPTPIPGAQIETGAARTTPNQATTAIGGGKADKSNGLLQVQSGSGGGGMNGNSSPITLLRITVVTGGDDLRDGSVLRAFILTRGGGRIVSFPLNCRDHDPYGGNVSGCAGIPDHTSRTFDWELRVNSVPGHWTPKEIGTNAQVVVYPQDVYRFGLAFESVNGDFQTGDNWNLDKLEVEYVVAGNTLKMFEGAGTPLFRFKTKEDWMTNPLSLPK